MRRDGELHSVIGMAYEAAAGASDWNDFATGLLGLLDGQSVAMWLIETRSMTVSALVADQVPEGRLPDYSAHYRKLDPWMAKGQAVLADPAAQHTTLTGDEIIPQHVLRESEFYRDFARHAGAFHFVGGVMRPAADSVATLAVLRPEDGQPFTAEDRAQLEVIQAHVARALGLWALTPRPEAALEGFGCAAMVVDRELRVVAANQPARALAAKGDAIRFQRRSGPLDSAVYLAAAVRTEDARLRVAVQGVVDRQGAGGAALLRGGSGDAALAAMISPVPASLTQSLRMPAGLATGEAPCVARGLALVALRRLDRVAAPAPGLLADLFGLTLAEAEVAGSVALGGDAASVARIRGVSVATIRTQIRRVLEKTGTASLRDLAVVLAGLGR